MEAEDRGVVLKEGVGINWVKEIFSYDRGVSSGDLKNSIVKFAEN